MAAGAFTALEVQLTVLTLVLVGVLILERRLGSGWPALGPGQPARPARG